jgi:DGQHR domain-containing protein
MAGFSINAAVLKQKGHELFCFGMNSAELKRICYVTPRSHDAPDEIQRIISPRRAKEIGEYIRQANSLLPNSVVVSLTEDVTIRDSGTAKVKVLQFPGTEGKFAYILDGQHRLEGFKHSDGIEFDLPVVAIHNADDALRGKIFADINSKQKAVSDIHLLSLYYQIKEMPADETPVMDVIIALNDDANSPVHQKIKMLEKDKGWAKNTAFKKWLSPHLNPGGSLSIKTIAERTQIIKDYLTAIKNLWPEAWGDNKDYTLTKAFGFEIMFGVFPAAKLRCDLNNGRQYTADNFKTQMEPLTTANMELPGGGTIRLDWSRKMGVINNSKTRTLITKQMRDILARADDE